MPGAAQAGRATLPLRGRHLTVSPRNESGAQHANNRGGQVFRLRHACTNRGMRAAGAEAAQLRLQAPARPCAGAAAGLLTACRRGAAPRRCALAPPGMERSAPELAERQRTLKDRVQRARNHAAHVGALAGGVLGVGQRLEVARCAQAGRRGQGCGPCACATLVISAPWRRRRRRAATKATSGTARMVLRGSKEA